MKIIDQLEKGYLRDDIPEFSAGDDVRVSVRIKEGEKVRTQIFAGTVLSRRGGGTGETFTVRKLSSNGVFIERVFPLHSPNIEKIERVKAGKVRRSKLYYLREMTGKSARIEEKFFGKKTDKKADKPTTKTAEKTAEKSTEKIVDEVDDKAVVEN
jgi:large subunit ribosomal protein L19